MKQGAALPLAFWVALLGSGSVVSAVAVTGAVLVLTQHLGVEVLTALVAGVVAGLAGILVAVLAATRLAKALRDLHEDAVRRLVEPGVPVRATPRVVTRASLEVAELSQTLEALHRRVRVADQLGERHRREAETAGAGVFELLSGLVAAEEGARGQLAAELHDTVAQSLMIARGLLAAQPTEPAEIAKLADYVEDAEEQVRAVMARTRPPALRDGDLATAVGNLRMDMHARYGLSVQVSWPQSPYPLPLASAVTVYRFFQEALLNVVKHADVDDAFLCLQVDEHAVLATVRDEGPGFDPDLVRPDRGRHVGLGLLRERARLSGGGLEVSSERGVGTTLLLRLPRPSSAVQPPTGLPQQGTGDAPLRRMSDRAARSQDPSGPPVTGPLVRTARQGRGRRAATPTGGRPAVMHSRSHQARRCTARSSEPSASGRGLQEARTSTSLVSVGSSTNPNVRDAVRVTVPPAAVWAAARSRRASDSQLQPTSASAGSPAISGSMSALTNATTRVSPRQPS